MDDMDDMDDRVDADEAVNAVDTDDRWDPRPLSAAARSCWGKSSGDSDLPMPLHRHLSDAGEVAGLLWDNWLPRHIRDLIRGPLDPDQGRTLLVWLAAAHDLGKATPAFASQVPRLADAMHDNGLPFPARVVGARSPHSAESHVILRDWLVAQGFSEAAATALAVVPGGHHGAAPHPDQLDTAAWSWHRGSGPWLRVQEELADWVAAAAGIEPLLPLLAENPPTPQAQVLVTGVVILADWIASDPGRFPYSGNATAHERARAGWRSLELTEPWLARPIRDDAALFRARFDLPDGTELRPSQRDVVAAARGITEPGLIIVEAPMGEGKTEAALMAAEILADRFDLGGCFIALPTMATSDAMFGRVSKWVERLGAGRVSMFLAHGKAALNADYRGLAKVGRLAGIGDCSTRSRVFSDECGAGAVVAHEWLSGRKKGVLANFVVGTIDQVLMGALRSRHLVLRHLALAGKVVVIDEVHCADEFMTVFLERALHWLAAYRVPTVLMSATLSSSTRATLIAAYRSGMATATKPVSSAPPAILPRRRAATHAQFDRSPDSDPLSTGYPLVTSTTSTATRIATSASSGRQLRVHIDFADDRTTTLLEIIADAQREGGVVAVIRNTVRRAQSTADLLRQEFPETEVVLAHSRFLAIHRSALERDLRERLGPPGSVHRRPYRMIVVGTQVLEQSLDVDFDLMITDLAPVDLVLQRIGRLHRHYRHASSRGRMAGPRCVVVGVEDWAAEPPRPDEGSAFVYGEAALLRSAAVLRGHTAGGCGIVLPDDIPGLVNEAYSHALVVPPTWVERFAAAEAEALLAYQNKVDGARTFVLDTVPRNNLVGWAAVGVGDAESPRGRAKVRDGDDGLEVLVVQEIDGRRYVLPEIDDYGGRELPLDGEPPWALARAVARCSIRLPASLAAPWRLDRVIAALEAAGLAAWQSSPWLRGELVLLLDENLEAELAGVRVRYSRVDGLVTSE